MIGCPLTEDTKEVRSIPTWQSFRHPRRRPSLDKILVQQGGKQLCIFHRNQIILWWFLNTILRGELLLSLLSRLLVILLKLGLITWILNNIGGGHNIGDMLINRIRSLRSPFHHNHLLLFLLETVDGSTFYGQSSFLDPLLIVHQISSRVRIYFFQTHMIFFLPNLL